MNISELELGKDYAIGHRRTRGTLVRIYRHQDYRGKPVKLAEFRLEDGTTVSHPGKEIYFTWEEQEVFNKKREEQQREEQERQAQNKLAQEAVQDALIPILGPLSPEFEVDVNGYRQQVVVRLSLDNAHKLAGSLVAATLEKES